MGRVCYHPCETACNRGDLDEAVGINSVERFLGDEAIRQGWTVERRPAADRQARAGRRRRPGGPLGGVPPRAARARRHRRATPRRSRRDDALRASRATACPARCSTPRSSRIISLGVALELGSEVTDLDALLSRGL